MTKVFFLYVIIDFRLNFFLLNFLFVIVSQVLKLNVNKKATPPKVPPTSILRPNWNSCLCLSLFSILVSRKENVKMQFVSQYSDYLIQFQTALKRIDKKLTRKTKQEWYDIRLKLEYDCFWKKNLKTFLCVSPNVC